MKRAPWKPASSGNSTRTCAISANRLSEVRGGISIQIVGPTPFEMPLQHNETFVRL